MGNLLMLNGNGFFSATAGMFLREYAVFWIAGLILCLPVVPWLQNKLRRFPRLYGVASVGLYPLGMACLLLVCVCYMVKSGYNPFIYFNF